MAGTRDPVTATDVRIQLLGGFRVVAGERAVPDAAWRGRRTRAVVALLALAPGRRLHRERLMEALWPDLEPVAAANNLDRAVMAARRALDPAATPATSVLRRAGEQVELRADGGVQVDVDAFALAAGRARRSQEPTDAWAAVDRYAGDLLPEDAYEAWAAERRAALRREYLDLLLAAAAAHRERGEAEGVLKALRRLVAEEPAHEAAQRALMTVYAERGQADRALRQYEEFRTALARDLDAAPDAATHRLHRQLLARRQAPAEAVPPMPALPASLTSLIGRERELADIPRLLGEARLLTLTGAGGVGKTRLALAVAGVVQREYPDGVWLVELAALADPALVEQAVARGLGIKERPGQAIVEAVVGRLAVKRLLLVLDNCEHLLDACAVLTERLLRACPGVHVLATSREALRVGGERAWRVPSLPAPAVGAPPPDEVARYAAVQLFVERARFAEPRFALTPANAQSVAAICRRLDGVPLALELAAARLQVLSVEQLAARLEDRFRLLTGGGRAALPRQRTLQATLDWSHDLLTAAERIVFRRLAVFAGGWTMEAAEAVCAGDGVAEADVLDLVSGLVGKSLVLAEDGLAGQGRFRLPETVRQYARDRLLGASDGPVVRDRRRDWCLALAEAAEPSLRGPDQARWLDRLEREHDNLRAALRWADERADAVTILRLGGAIYRFWWLRGYVGEGRAWLTRALASGVGRVAGAAPPLRRARAKGLHGAAVLAQAQGDLAASGALLAESLLIWRELGDRWQEANALHNLGAAAIGREDYAAARALTDAALAIWREVSDRVGITWATCGLGQIAAYEGEDETATSYFEESLALGRPSEWTQPRTIALQGLGVVAFHRADYATALTRFRESLTILAGMGERNLTPDVLEWIAAAAVAQGRPERGLRLAGAAAVLREATGIVSTDAPPWIAERDRWLSAATRALDGETATAAWAAGRALALEQAIAEALADADLPPVAPLVAVTPPLALDGLTRRELDVLRLVAAGRSNREIAADLALSVRTVERHITNLYGKIDARGRADATAYAIRHGLA